jgi:UDP-N-acetylmuramyl tripeptide synthase
VCGEYYQGLFGDTIEPMLLSESRRLTGRNLLMDGPGAVLDVALAPRGAAPDAADSGTAAGSGAAPGYGAPPGSGAAQGADGDPAADAVIAAWRRAARRMLDAVGWHGEQLHVRRFASGASLALSAPPDALYAATEVNEWAWAAALAEVTGASGDPTAAAKVTGGAGDAGEDSAPSGAGDPWGVGEPTEPGNPDIGDHPNDANDPNTFAAAAIRLRGVIEREREPALIALRDAAAALGVAFLFDDDEATVGLGAGSLTWARGEMPAPAAVDWAAVYDVPVALVTGTNGKTTTVRLVAAMLTAAGFTAGVTSTDRIAVGGDVLDHGDYSGPGGARTLLRDRRVQAAVLETARGGLLRRGLAVEAVAAVAVTNIAADHLGDYGVETLDDLAAAKLLIAGAVVPGGRVVLNADDPLLAARGSGWPAPVTWFSLAPPGPSIAAHLAAGGDAAFLDEDRLVLARGPHRRETVTTVANVPITFGGAARYNVANALAAIALAAALGLPSSAMAAGLAALRNDAYAVTDASTGTRTEGAKGQGAEGGMEGRGGPGGNGEGEGGPEGRPGPGAGTEDRTGAETGTGAGAGPGTGAGTRTGAGTGAEEGTGTGAKTGTGPERGTGTDVARLAAGEPGNPGRAVLMEIDGFRALLDYAHNPHGLAALLSFTANLPARRRLLLLGQAGDRDDESIRELARTAWSQPGGPPDRIVLKELGSMLRGRAPGAVTALLEDELLRLGAHPEDLGHADDEIDAVRQALDWAQPGDLLLLLVHTEPQAAMALLRQRQAGGF